MEGLSRSKAELRWLRGRPFLPPLSVTTFGALLPGLKQRQRASSRVPYETVSLLDSPSEPSTRFLGGL